MNRQVPKTQAIEPIAVVGNGKVARHMMHYFVSVGQPYTHWFRQQPAVDLSASAIKPSKISRLKHGFSQLFNHSHQPLADSVEQVTKVLLLIDDDQIEQFIRDNPVLKNKTLIHFSGSLHTELALGCHPLMTFGANLYSLEAYQAIPFVVDHGVDFKNLFPLFTNPVHHVKTKHKVTYHAMCVMAGNFTQMLWQAIADELEGMSLPADLMSQYLLQNTVNFINNPHSSATGPMVRGDVLTVAKHQKALTGHPLKGVYQSFFDLHKQTNQNNINSAHKRNQL